MSTHVAKHVCARLCGDRAQGQSTRVRWHARCGAHMTAATAELVPCAAAACVVLQGHDKHLQ